MEVIELYKDIIDGKTGQPLFNSKAAKVHRSTLKHIRWNCLSDIPGVSYCVQVGEDKHGIPLLKCTRGTSAIEGLHQKLRNLVRGYSNSPRFVRAIVFEFTCRWNHDLEIAARSLPKECEHFYEGSALEKEIQIMNKWSSDFDVHPEWNSTKDFSCTGEHFGVPADEDLPVMRDNEESSEADQQLEDDAARAAEASDEMEAGDQSNSVVVESIRDASGKSDLPASAAWLCQCSKRKRPVHNVQGKEEWKYFEDNCGNHQDSSIGVTADNCSFIDWSEFAQAWNEKVHKEDQLGVSSSFACKNAAILKEAWKRHQWQANQATAMLGHADAARNLQVQH